MFSFNFGQWKVSIKQQIIVTLIMLTYAIVYLIESWDLSFESLLFPRFLFICIAITGFLSIKKSLSFRKKEDLAKDENEEEIHSFRPSRRLLFFVSLTFLMILFLELLGAILSICIFLAVSMYYLEVRKLSLLVLIPICTAGVVYGVFKLWLSVPLPAGILGF